MTEEIKIKLGIVITLILQSIALAYFLAETKATMQADIKNIVSTLKRIERQQVVDDAYNKRIEGNIKVIDQLEKRVDRVERYLVEINKRLYNK